MALSIIFRYLLLNKIIILVFLSFNSYIESSSIIGNFPTSKRLNNGYYFVISSKNVVIADSTFTAIIEKYTFTSSLYETLYETYSTTIAQFPKEYNGYKIYDETGYYHYASAMPAGRRRKANLDALIDSAMNFEKTSYKGLFDYIRYIEKAVGCPIKYVSVGAEREAYITMF